MAERDIRSVRALRKRLTDFGVSISEPQLGRIANALPKMLSTPLLAALCAALDTTPGELLIIPGKRPTGARLSTSIPVAASAAAAAQSASITRSEDPTANPTERPRATVFPRPKY